MDWTTSRPGGKCRRRDAPQGSDGTAFVEEKGKHPDRVFTFKGRPIAQVNTRAWRNALKRAGIENFRWHDLRYVWVTWHVMAGTTMAELQELGAWKSALMVKRYAHFAPEQLRAAAAKLATFSYTVRKMKRRNQRKVLNNWLPESGKDGHWIEVLSMP